MSDTSEPTAAITVEEVRKLALPLGATVLTGHDALRRKVTWTALIYPQEIGPKPLNKGELVILAPLERNLSIPNRDATVIRQAIEAEASAVVLAENPSSLALQEARSSNMPLILLPSGHNVREVERTVITLLLDRQAQIERRGQQVYRQLTKISSQNLGMAELVSAIADFTNKSVIVHDKRLNVVQHIAQPDVADLWDQVVQFTGQMSNLPDKLRNRHQVSTLTEPVIEQPIEGQLRRLVAPIISQAIGRGYLSIISRTDHFDEVDFLVAQYGAEACALEMAKAKAISETEKRLRGTFLDRLLIGDINQQEAIRQGERFNHNMAAPHIAMVICWQGSQTPSLRRLETLINGIVSSRREEALVWQRDDHVVIFHATNEDDPIDSSLALAEAIRQEARRQQPQHRVAIGLGQKAMHINEWRDSYQDAQQAVDLARRLETDEPLYIGDLGVYQLILRLHDRETLLNFANQMLGPLLDYDERNRADLVKTLEAFFACHGNLSKTAEMLIVHRNTLLYRMNRISEIADMDLNRPETRLGVHLALVIRQLLLNK
ncbi:MAG: PucR family transcriptional regulator [Anaerolineae bacterium]